MPKPTETTSAPPTAPISIVLRRRGEVVMRIPELTIGCDLSDRSTTICLLDAGGEVIERRKVPATAEALSQFFGEWQAARVVMEVGTHSPWISRLAKVAGHEVIVANPREVKSISQSTRKNDERDAEQLARLGRVDPKLLHPIQHRGEEAQKLMISIRLRAHLVKQRVALVVASRGQAKSLGERVSAGPTKSFPKRARADLSGVLLAAIEPGLHIIETLNAQIDIIDRKIENPPEEYRAEVDLLRQVSGVGHLIALAYILTIEDPRRFRRGRDVGAYLGLCPKQDQSGELDKQLSISKAGDAYLRTLLVNAAQCILSRGPDSDLKRFGQRLEERKGPAARKRAVIALSRKLAVVLHRLWITGAIYEPLHRGEKKELVA